MSGRILYFDSAGGAAGDMIMAALIDLGADRERLARELAGLRAGAFDIRVNSCSSHGIGGIRVEVHCPDPGGGTHGGRHARGLSEIRAMIQGAGLPERARAWSIRTFERLAEAEAGIHGSDPEDVHFHEVGALDSIVDIAGSCLALDMLEVDDVAFGALPLGSGTTQCRHGTIPIPAPATLELLKNEKVIYTDEPFEMVTPTGAALLSTWKTLERLPPASRVLGIGYGFGHRELSGRPNLIRAVLMERPAAEKSSFDECIILECNVDDTTPELLGSLSEKLLRCHALDVFITPVQMKKQRPGALLTVLCRPDTRDSLIELIFAESTTFGIREHPVTRTTLERREDSVETGYGKVRIKVGMWKKRIVTRAPEHEDCARLAAKAGVSVRSVYEAALHAASREVM